MRFFLKTTILMGRGSLENVKRIISEGERVLIFSSRSMDRLGFLSEVADYVEEAGGVYETIIGLPPEPSVENVEEVLPKVEEFSPETFIALGGGSVIDVAKAVKVFYDAPGLDFDSVAIFSRFKKAQPLPKLKTRLIAIPSTSGAGSEVSAASVIKKGDTKYTIVSPELCPDYAILDPRLPEKMPREVARNSGLDVLVHAIEAYVSKASTPFSDALAVKAARIIFERLEDSVNGDAKAREEVHYAATMAGIAFLNGRLGLVHAMSHKSAWIGPHGLVNAIFLPYVMEFNMERAREKYDAMARELGLSSADELLEKVKELNEKLGVPKLSEIVKEEEFLGKVEDMSRKTYEDPLVSFNPVEPSVEDIKNLYLRALHD
ncbi:iron-containing alcohol dehydrogenase [Pyrococcus abyssi]|uniref:Alcohol dehydrogenase n=1 Tax=Pyrococcus abyssi (strain GE5 / Orsay) TaxID=272844 RepID=Q9UZ43_PYRAB|nr:iron-containing alcohol dehydrogenase [Pyrococcus abyssi]CAB50216.1 Alcohol dehydrogenase [Pyrococcus abyssi GE5]CCE70752.1 TPA: alcohol dehydrogenase, iron-containing [Pyrococcus abyssi GE5]